MSNYFLSLQMNYDKCYYIFVYVYCLGKLFLKCDRLSHFIVILSLGTGILFPSTSNAIILIKDAEIENTLQIIAKPIYKAAKIEQNSIKIILIQAPNMNAFVVDNKNIYFTSELLLKLKTPEMLQAVIAHEVAHITSGHLLKTSLNLNAIRNQNSLGVILGIIVATTMNADAGLAISIGSETAAQNKYLRHSRGQEVTADAISIKLLQLAKINPIHAINVMDLFVQQEKTLTINQNTYNQTHPLSTKRTNNLTEIINQSQQKKYHKDERINYLHKRMLAKLSAFSGDPIDTLKKTAPSETNEIALLKRTIALHLKPDPKNAFITLRKLQKLIPQDPYFMELEGQMYLETGQPVKAIEAFSKASKILPQEPTMLVWMGISHLAIGKKKNNIKALEVLKAAYNSDPVNPKMLKYLASAYALNGDIGRASLTTAEYFMLLGTFNAATIHAKRATKILKPNSVGAQRAKDILNIISKLE